MKILIADSFPEASQLILKQMGMDVSWNPSLKDETLTRALESERPEVLVVRSTKVTAEMIRSSADLRLIVRAGAGYNTIDIETASEMSVYVANCPGKNAVAVAELVMGHIISLDRRIPENVVDLWNGAWNKKTYSTAAGLSGRVLGIVGVGTIAREVIARARAFGLRVIAWSRSLTQATADDLQIGFCETPLDVAANADIISVHVAATSETKGMIDSAFFDAMKDGSLFVNTSRADVVDEEALLGAIKAKDIRAGLDVMADEPSSGSETYAGPLRDERAVYCTHHIGASTAQAQQAVADEVVAILDTYRTTGRVRNCVNLQDRTPATYVVSVRHRNKVGVLSDVLRIIREAEINVESMENVIFSGLEGACANIQIDERLPDDQLEQIRNLSEDVHSVNVAPIEW